MLLWCELRLRHGHRRRAGRFGLRGETVGALDTPPN
jgi:hypothetical protein